MAVIRRPSSTLSSRGGGGGVMKASTVLIIMMGVPILASTAILLMGAYYIINDQQPAQIKDGTPVQSPPSGQGIDPGLDRSGNKYHIIFSTGCSLYQDWQSYVFFYHAWKIEQPGIVTRIVSGCRNKKEEDALQKIFDEQIQPMAPDRFKLHITPDYSGVKPGINYKYFNKPFGTKHWMEHALGFPDNPIDEDAIVMLFDPDQLILRPFENNDFSNTEWMHLNGKEPRTRIEHGKPMGQMYGFGIQWKEKTTMKHVAPDELPSPVDSLTFEEARAGYGVGPPYVATARDMYAIANKWSQFVPLVHDEYPFLLAEMFGYCLAAAHLKLPHQTAASFMVSSPGANHGEGWKYIKDLSDEELCSRDVDNSRFPSVMHFCQRYTWGPYFFGKHRLPKDFLSCNMPLLAEPPVNLLSQYEHAIFPTEKLPQTVKVETARQHVFSVCRLLPAINEAGLYFRQQHCPNGGNQNRTLVFNYGLGANFTVSGSPRYRPD